MRVVSGAVTGLMLTENVAVVWPAGMVTLVIVLPLPSLGALAAGLLEERLIVVGVEEARFSATVAGALLLPVMLKPSPVPGPP